MNKTTFLKMATVALVFQNASYASCTIDISDISRQDMSGIKALKRKLEDKGYEISTEANAEFKLYAQYSYVDQIGSAHQLIDLRLYQKGSFISNVETKLEDGIFAAIYERRSLVRFAKTISPCQN